MKQTLGKLRRVAELREIWEREAVDFTPWLAENLSLLADTIGLDLELEAQEKRVGSFRADIFCRETVNNSPVLIENQLGKTDHIHLGQLLTYAAGLNAVTLVWIAKRFTDEHQATLEWLNEITGDEINIFGLEIELWKIENSQIAPKFNIVAKPNQWTKGRSGSNAEVIELTPARELQLEFWTKLYEHINEQDTTIRMRTPRAQYWMDFALGTTRAHMYAFVNTQDKRIGVTLVIKNSDRLAIYNLLKREKCALEEEFGQTLDWEENRERQSSNIVKRNSSADPYKRENWPEHQKWLLETLESFKRVFGDRIREIDPGNWQPEDFTEE